MHHLRYKKMSPQWTRKWFENRKRKTCSLSKTMQHHHPFLLQRISKVGIISTSPCLFLFPRKFQKFPESFEIFVVSSTPDPVTHINPPSPEAGPRPRHEAASCAFTCWPNIWVRTKETRLLPRRILGSFKMQGVGVAGFFATLFRPKNLQKRLEMFRQKMWRR